MEVVNADVNWLQWVRDKFEDQYLEEEEALRGDIGDQWPWMQMTGAVPQASDAGIPHDLEPLIYPDVDWVANIITPFELIEKSKDDMNVKWSASPNYQREIGDIELVILNHE